MWIGLLVTFILQGVFDNNYKILPLAFAISIFANIALAQIIAYSIDEKLKTRNYYLIVGFSLLIALLISAFSTSFLFESLPICLAVAYPIFQVSVMALKRSKKRSHTNFLSWIVIIGGLHTLDYAFLRTNNNFAPYGFSIALMTYLSYAFVVPLILLEKSKNKTIQREKLAAIGFMSAGISHEFNNSLNNLKQAIMALRVLIENKKESQAKELLNDMDKVIILASNTINSIKGLTKIEDQKKTIDLFQFVNTICNLYKGLTFEHFIIQNKILHGVKIEINELVLYNSLANIIKNAIEASEKSEDQVIIIESFTNEKSVLLDVSDFGCGIKESAKDTLFDGLSSKSDGLGFGLKNSKENLQKIGGDLELINLQNPTKFRIILRK